MATYDSYLPGQFSWVDLMTRDGEAAVRFYEALFGWSHTVDHDDGTTLRVPAEVTLNEVEQQVLQAIETDGSLIDDITQTSGIPVHRVLSTISVLEMRSLIRRVGGNRVARS